MEEPNYKVIELQAENENLKDKLITSLEIEVRRLNDEVSYLRALISPKKDIEERHVGDNLIAPSSFKPRTLIRTLSEAGALLERRSLNSSHLPISAEDLNSENIK